MILEILLLIVVDILLGVGAALLNLRQQQEERGMSMSPALTIGAMVGAVIVHALASLPFLGVAGPRLHFMVLLSLGTPLCVGYGMAIARALSHGAVEGLYGLHTAKAPKSDFSRARALFWEGEFERAVAQYRQYYAENPEDPAPLFEAAQRMAGEGRLDDAVGLIRQAMVDFRENDGVYAKAAFRLAELYRHRLDDESAARQLLAEVARRAPNSMEGNAARALLREPPKNAR